MWIYTPSTIRLESHNETNLVSGVYVTDGASNEFILSLCDSLLESRTSESVLTAAVSSNVSNASIVWEDIEVTSRIDLPGVASFLAPLKGDFDISPDLNQRVTIFKFASQEIARRKQNAREFACITDCSSLNHRRVRIQSSPFSDVNAALFMGYITEGVISYVGSEEVDGRDVAHTVLVDARYLDGMAGGIVCTEVAGRKLGPSVGLVGGQLIKKNGEGSLTLVIPWSEIIPAIVAAGSSVSAVAKGLQQAAAAGSGPRPFGEVSRNRYSGVVVVQSRLKGGRKVWGSGVIVGRDLIVTNKHVVKDYLGIDVWLEKYTRRHVVAVAEPLDGVDLVFLRLTKNLPGKYKPVPLNCSVSPGQSVYSVGYGLFYPQKLGPALQPLYSQGVIANEGKAQLLANNKEHGSSMLVSTAACWNGSSGGGLFNENNELVGLMASNARDETTGKIMQDMSFVIPASVVQKALDLLNSASNDSSSTQFRDLWMLKPTHLDTRQRFQKIKAKL